MTATSADALARENAALRGGLLGPRVSASEALAEVKERQSR
ncbi:hypothetical protein AB0K18_43025 [Nonomuraea sp. NPDC049421]